MGLKAGSTALGGYLGGPAGAAFGSSLFGSGDYTLNENSIITNHQVPTFREGKRSVIVKHREYLRDIFSSTGFSITQFNVNSGLDTTFPWLAQIANNYEQYKFHGLCFEFKSSSGSAIASTNNSLGVVIMASEYNVLKPAFSYKQQMEAYEFSCSAKPSESFLHPIECAPSDTPYNLFNVRDGDVTSDRRLWDLCDFYIATQGMQAAGINIGELWVTYEVEFLKPILPLQSYNALSARLSMGPYASNNILGQIIPSWKGSFSPVVSSTNPVYGYDTITFPSNVLSGVFLLQIIWRGAVTAAAVPPSLTLSGASVIPAFAVNTASNTSNTGTTTGVLFYEIMLSVSNPTGATPTKLIFDSGNLPTTPASIDILVMQVSPSF